jgi:UV DNA damage repair endonuclease
MVNYIESLFNVFQLVNKKAEKQQDKRFKLIALTIYNYIRKMAKDNEVDLKEIHEAETINLIPIFEYISYNNIELYDFSKIEVTDVDVSKAEDLERFVLTHIYYITQK